MRMRARRFPAARCLAALLLLCMVSRPRVAQGATVPGAVSEAPEVLLPGIDREGFLSRAESHSFRVIVPADRRWAVIVEQLGVDIELAARWPGAEPLRIDSPLDRDGIEILLLPPDATAETQLTVTAQATAGRPGRYRIRLEAIDGDANARRLVALEVVSAAAEAYATAGGEAWQRSRQLFLDAVELWGALGEPRLAAQCLYSAAVLHRLLGDELAALELARQVLPRWQALGDSGREADTLNEIGLLESTSGRIPEAREALWQALELQQQSGDLYRQAATSNNLCLLHLMESAFDQAIACYGPALELIRAAQDEEHEAVALTNLGWAHRSLGEPEQALDYFQRAATLQRAAGQDRREAETLNNLALLHRQLGEPQEALQLYLRALEIFRRQGNVRWQGTVLHNLGAVYQMLGDPDRARIFYQQALTSRQQLGDLRGEANGLKILGRLSLDEGRIDAAETMFRQALEIEERRQDRRAEAVALRLIGQVQAARGEHRSALETYAEALIPLRSLGDREQEAQVLLYRGRSRLELEEWEAAGRDLGEAREIFHSLGMELAESDALYRLALMEHAVGRGDRALLRVDEAIGLLESLRSEVGDPDLKASFSGTRWGVYELRVELLMARYDATGETRHLRAALETSERARASGLVELLRQADADVFEGIEPQLEKQLRSARRQLHSRAGERRKLLAKGAPDAERTAAEARFIRALTELEGLEAEVRRRSPGYAALRHPEPLTAAQIQGLLEPGTVLLEFALGRHRSVLYRVTSETLQGIELPPRQVVEEAARQVYEELSTVQSGGHPGAAAAGLAQLVLGAALEGVDAERLVVVADGVLHYLSFAALPLPTADGVGSPQEPLMSRYEVVHLPSASVLAAVRRQSEGRAQAPHWAAILADPVFDGQDSRLVGLGVDDGRESDPVEDLKRSPGPQSLREGDGIADGERQTQDLALPRLRSSRREAETLASLAPPGELLVALDFDADRSLAMGGRLAEYRIVHFATHSVIDARYPVLSGLALSLYDRHGQPLDGFLRLRDIYGLRLQADLVVLSACRTALGKEVRGEGLLGLTRGFLHAGARSVVASLWAVPDRATSELMERFYRAMVEEGLTPAAALRRAQLSMVREHRWKDPYNWAGFVLFGEWR